MIAPIGQLAGLARAGGTAELLRWGLSGFTALFLVWGGLLLSEARRPLPAVSTPLEIVLEALSAPGGQRPEQRRDSPSPPLPSAPRQMAPPAPPTAKSTVRNATAFSLENSANPGAQRTQGGPLKQARPPKNMPPKPPIQRRAQVPSPFAPDSERAYGWEPPKAAFRAAPRAVLRSAASGETRSDPEAPAPTQPAIQATLPRTPAPPAILPPTDAPPNTIPSPRFGAISSAAVKLQTVPLEKRAEGKGTEAGLTGARPSGFSKGAVNTAPAAPVSQGPVATPRRVAPTELDSGFALLQGGQARYPARARRLGRSGEARLEVEIDSDGTVRSVRVLKETGQWGFGQAARAAYEGARFSPPRAGGRPVRVVWRKTLRFTP